MPQIVTRFFTVKDVLKMIGNYPQFNKNGNIELNKIKFMQLDISKTIGLYTSELQDLDFDCYDDETENYFGCSHTQLRNLEFDFEGRNTPTITLTNILNQTKVLVEGDIKEIFSKHLGFVNVEYMEIMSCKQMNDLNKNELESENVDANCIESILKPNDAIFMVTYNITNDINTNTDELGYVQLDAYHTSF